MLPFSLHVGNIQSGFLIMNVRESNLRKDKTMKDSYLLRPLYMMIQYSRASFVFLNKMQYKVYYTS